MLEDEYFRKKDQQLLEKLRQAGAADRARRDMGARIGSDDPDMLQELQALGFTPDTVILLPMIPVVQMAWADGRVAHFRGGARAAHHDRRRAEGPAVTGRRRQAQD